MPAIGGSAVMRNLFAVLEKVAPTDLTVLLEGESGTGKDLLALHLHYDGPLRDGPFIKIHCPSIPEDRSADAGSVAAGRSLRRPVPLLIATTS